MNTGTAAVNLANLKIRYFYTVDGDKPQSFWCDHAGGMLNGSYASITGAVSGSLLKLTPAKAGADSYVEIALSSAAGIIGANGWVEIQGRIAKNDWSNYSQSNDYSFNPTGTSYVDWTKVTIYSSGTLVWGVEP